MKCPNCGTISRIREKDKFCYKCGCNLQFDKAKKAVKEVLENGVAAAGDVQQINKESPFVFKLDAEKIYRAVNGTKKEEIMTASSFLERFSNKIVPVLVEEVIEALRVPDFDGLEFAAIVLDDARKYHNLYPRARGNNDDSMYKAVEKIRNRNAVNNGDE